MKSHKRHRVLLGYDLFRGFCVSYVYQPRLAEFEFAEDWILYDKQTFEKAIESPIWTPYSEVPSDSSGSLAFWIL